MYDYLPPDSNSKVSDRDACGNINSQTGYYAGLKLPIPFLKRDWKSIHNFWIDTN
jgi:hypothetical protein